MIGQGLLRQRSHCCHRLTEESRTCKIAKFHENKRPVAYLLNSMRTTLQWFFNDRDTWIHEVL